MTLLSARKQFDAYAELYDDPEGFCFPLALDASLPRHELPTEWYDYFSRQNRSGGSWNQSVSRLLREYFGVEPQYNGHPIAKFTNFGGSPQTYMPDVAYGRDIVPDDMPAELADKFRLVRLLEQSALRGNVVLTTITQQNGGDHSLALLRLTEFAITDGTYYSPSYAVVDPDSLELGHYIYDATELSGMDEAENAKPFAPLPQVHRNNVGQDTSTWELVILPSAPQ